MSEFPKAYEPGKVEQKWYQFWLKQGYFTPKIDWKKRPFVIIMPPPNVTGELHLGHALTATIEDIMIRWHRMRGEPTLWLPGVDHAGIATQVVVEQRLAEEGLTKHDLGRTKFLERVWEWAAKCRRIITEQHQRLGASCDWSRECFTLDEGPSRAVHTAFVRLYNRGLIYRGERIINWCPRCQTALSDLEVDHKEIKGNLYYIKYPLAEGNGFVTVATTRPETYLGDTAVAVNHEDKRYQSLVGKKVILPVIGRVIPIIADEAVDLSFGTGVLKITPAHDPVDFEVAERHNLPRVNIFNPDATTNENAGPYAGLDRFVCRAQVISDLKKAGLLEKVEPYSLSVGHCDRCQTMVEPRLSQQWFIKIAPLAEKAIQVVDKGLICIIPAHFTKVYLNWMENIRDWCISRQLWWGHRIPVWYCSQCNYLTVTVDEPATCANCHSPDITQDPDVLDTWFSSALWTHSTLGWPEDTEDLRYFYPSSVMETGYDILFFWVARMIMMGLEDTGEIPFHTVYLHGLIRDEKGEKMSKIRGNVLNPIDVIERYGTDALRFALTAGVSPGNDINIGPSKLEGGRNFVNKLWNATRFVIRSLEANPEDIAPTEGLLLLEDRWILSRLNQVVSKVCALLENYQFGEALEQIHEFFWGEFCDWYIEIAKIRLHPSQMTLSSPLPVLTRVLETSLRLLHPFMPFVTEELWQRLKPFLPPEMSQSESILIASYPVAEKEAEDVKAEKVMNLIFDIIRSLRNIRAQFRIEPAKWVVAEIYVDEFLPETLSQSQAIETLARVRPLTIRGRNQRQPKDEKILTIVLNGAELVLPWASVLDLDAERKRCQKEIGTSQEEIARLEARLKDTTFLNKAPATVIEKEKEKLKDYQVKLQKLKDRLAQLA